LRTTLNLVCICFIVSFLTGCQQVGVKDLLVVDFKDDTTLRYKLVSERDIELNLDSTDSGSKSRQGKVQKMKEKLELVIAYKPIDIDPYGLTTIKAVCESAKVTRRSFSGKGSKSDAVESLAGKSFTFQVSPVGKIDDYSNLHDIVRQLGNKAFSLKSKKQGRVKDPDMISDFVALQWHFWDSIATIESPLKGLKAGQSWKTRQFIPLPMPRWPAKETTYTLSEITETETGRNAIITSSFTLSDKPLQNRPKPYTGKYRMSGMFGFLRNYKMGSLEGEGRTIFNIDSGTLESEQQRYKTKIEAKFLLPLGDSVPILTIDQKITVQLLTK